MGLFKVISIYIIAYYEVISLFRVTIKLLYSFGAIGYLISPTKQGLILFIAIYISISYL